MRYQLPVYPALAIFAGWAVFALYDLRPPREKLIRWTKIASVVVGAAVLISTLAYAYGFTRIYTRPITRIEASRWIYQNVPGPINLHIENGEGVYSQPVPFRYDETIRADSAYFSTFTANATGTLSQVYLYAVTDPSDVLGERSFTLTLAPVPDTPGPVVSATGSVNFSPGAVEPGMGFPFALNQAFPLVRDGSYSLRLQLFPGQEPVLFSGTISLPIQDLSTGDVSILSIPLTDALVGSVMPYSYHFTAQTDGMLTEAYLADVQSGETVEGPKTLSLAVKNPAGTEILAFASVTSDFSRGPDGKGEGYLLTLDRPIQVVQDERYNLELALQTGSGEVTLQGAVLANEGDWDDGLPYSVDGHIPFGGLYPQGVNFNMYWDDNEDKLVRFERILDQSDFLVITSSRQWGSLPRLPERFPLVTQYYRHLIGCPAERKVEWCYSVAKEGTFQGELGYELVKVFQSDPSMGPLRLNDQFAEEAFTVYDHPKVFLFKKTPAYDAQRTHDILEAADISNIIRLTPKKAGSHPANLMLPSDRLATQQENGTWSELFDPEALQNRNQVLGTALWYVCVALLGLAVYPLVRLALPGLKDRGYPLARTAGLLILAFLVWIAGSVRIPASRLTITAVILLIILVGGILAYTQRESLRREWQGRKRYYLMIEALALAFFLFDLALRLGNPDLWHPWKGGEKPMDFAYFNAILKSATFPPYDPWFAGGYLNYYYYGFVIMGVLVKWLGIVPAIGYNLILPTVFMLIAMGAFSVGWNLIPHSPRFTRFWVGLSAALVMVVLGNLGTVRMIYHGYQRLAAPGGVIEGANVLTRWGWALDGMIQTLQGKDLPYALADWYWIPSRVMPPDDNAITEFPFFTVLYGDPHAHLFAMPVALLALAWAVSTTLNRGRWKGLAGGVAGFLMGGLAIGALYPINLSDVYTYLPLGLAAVGYALGRYYVPGKIKQLAGLPPLSQRVLAVGLGVGLLAGLAILLYRPYTNWYGQAYSSVELWKGPRTPVSAYLTHWGLFLFVYVAWMAYETREWMAHTPLSSLRKLNPYAGLIRIGALVVLLAGAGLILLGVEIAWLVVPLAGWAGVLLLRPRMPDAKRVILFLFGTGLLITLMVEIVVVRGDIGRMNTVFKFYLQAWTLFSVGAAAAFGWLLLAAPRWKLFWRLAWQAPLVVLVASASMYTLLAGSAKIRDRMVPDAPHTLDGMEYMQSALYNNMGTELDLNQDYRAIRWMQDNVSGSPVIVEGASGNQYAWFSRFSIYTGNPDVVGWQWHQQQQRALIPGDPVSQRVNEVDRFYRTTSAEEAREFLNKYDVSYVIVGQLERGWYSGPGLDKFPALDGIFWRPVYQDREMAIYEVID